jgi:hypothetical protein
MVDDSDCRRLGWWMTRMVDDSDIRVRREVLWDSELHMRSRLVTERS